MAPGTSRCPPPELLCEIICFILIDYMNDLMIGPLSLKSPESDEASRGEAPSDEDLVKMKSNLEETDPFWSTPNPIAPLLCASYQLRAATLKVTSDALGIAVVDGTAGLKHLSVKPMTKLQPLRFLFANPCFLRDTVQRGEPLIRELSSPLLHAYYALAFTSRSASYRVIETRDAGLDLDDGIKYFRAIYVALDRTICAIAEAPPLYSAYDAGIEDIFIQLMHGQLRFLAFLLFGSMCPSLDAYVQDREGVCARYNQDPGLPLQLLKDLTTRIMGFTGSIPEEEFRDPHLDYVYALYPPLRHPLPDDLFPLILNMSRIQMTHKGFEMFPEMLGDPVSSTFAEIQKDYQDDIKTMFSNFDKLLSWEPPTNIASLRWQSCMQLVADMKASFLAHFPPTPAEAGCGEMVVHCNTAASAFNMYKHRPGIVIACTFTQDTTGGILTSFHCNDIYAMASDASRCPPPEILCEIICFILIDYINDLMIGPLSLKPPGLHEDFRSETPSNEDLVKMRSNLGETDPYRSAPNPIAPLLCASYQLRAATLKVTSDVLGIAVVDGTAGLKRLSVKPMTKLQPLRFLFANLCFLLDTVQRGEPLIQELSSPLLHGYYALAFTSRFASYRVIEQNDADLDFDNGINYLRAMCVALDRVFTVFEEILPLYSAHEVGLVDIFIQLLHGQLRFIAFLLFRSTCPMLDAYVKDLEDVCARYNQDPGLPLQLLKEFGTRVMEFIEWPPEEESKDPHLEHVYVLYPPLRHSSPDDLFPLNLAMSRIHAMYRSLEMFSHVTSSTLAEIQKDYRDDIKTMFSNFDKLLSWKPPRNIASLRWQSCMQLVADMKASLLVHLPLSPVEAGCGEATSGALE
ncbi:hypothetical protein NM688_g1111 [Phlebia brevispora]|uniref:Uncharacterized protein n=1 Tax=Phlebia brevispora TaxID=194682 RepID=A0ACC1TC84_9APHY|nr:hypothetical protein NM688_g1111 [Phlebia brevispora]